MIATREDLLQWKLRAGRQAPARVVLDLEADSLHRYQEKICLIQYADEEGVCLLDPLAMEDMRAFTTWLSESDIWMHGADYDMSLMLNGFNTLPHLILDTQIAARLLGFRQFGLAALVEHFYGIQLSKTNQKADWGKRPISQAMLEYAQSDVQYMLDMADKLCAELRSKGRYEWFLETCRHNMARARERMAEESPDSWRIRGCGRLQRRGLAALKTLWTWRDREAQSWDKPSFMVCSNDDLLRWSTALQEGNSITPHSRFHTHRAARFLKAVETFHGMDETDYPCRISRPRPAYDDQFETRLENWIQRRNEAAEKLDLDPSFVAPRAIMESIATNEETGFSHLLHWQREVMGIH